MRPRIDEGLSVESLGGESREAFRTSDLDKRLLRYGSAKQNALKFRRYLVEQHEDRLADALSGCGNYMTLRDYFTIGQTRLAKICTCKKHLLCPLCAIRRGAKSVRVYMAKVEELLKADPLLKQYFVTLTVKNGFDLGERFRHLTSSIRAYHKRRTGSRQTGEILKAHAAVWSFEFKRGKYSGIWHPHAHSIWLCREKPDAFKLSKEWESVTGDSMIVDVRPMASDNPVGAFLEVFKYALKFAELADADRLLAYKTLRGKRLQGSLGDLRGLDVEPSDSDDLLDDLPFIERFFSFVDGLGYVEKGTTGEVKTHAA